MTKTFCDRCSKEITEDQDMIKVVRCGKCIRRGTYDCPVYVGGDEMYSEPDDWFCGDGELNAMKEGDAQVTDNWADLCPICEYPFEHCQCRYGGSAHPDRSDRARVVFDHLYLLTAGQLDHVMNIQSFWQTSYGDEKRSKILLYLIHRAKENCGLDKPFMVRDCLKIKEGR